MIRGTFANIRLRNQLVPGVEGGFTRHLPDGKQMSIFDASRTYIDDVIDPRDTRRILIEALDTAVRKQPTSLPRKHAIMPV